MIKSTWLAINIIFITFQLFFLWYFPFPCCTNLQSSWSPTHAHHPTNIYGLLSFIYYLFIYLINLFFSFNFAFCSSTLPSCFSSSLKFIFVFVSHLSPTQISTLSGKRFSTTSRLTKLPVRVQLTFGEESHKCIWVNFYNKVISHQIGFILIYWKSVTLEL